MRINKNPTNVRKILMFTRQQFIYLRLNGSLRNTCQALHLVVIVIPVAGNNAGNALLQLDNSGLSRVSNCALQPWCQWTKQCISKGFRCQILEFISWI